MLNVNGKSISIGGLSAGGQMTAVMAHFARDEEIELKLQLMTVAATDYRQVPLEGSNIDPSCPYESFIKYKDVPWGPLGRLQWFMDHWIGTDAGMYNYMSKLIKDNAHSYQNIVVKWLRTGCVHQCWLRPSKTWHQHSLLQQNSIPLEMRLNIMEN